MAREQLRTASGEDTKERIYRAAVEVFYERGFSGASLRMVAARARAQMSSIYYHYDNKQDLLFDVMSRAVGDSTQSVLERVDPAAPPEQRLLAAIEGVIDWHTTYQREAFIADAELPRLEGGYRERVIELRDRQELIFRGILEEGAESGVFEIADVTLVNRMLMTAIAGVAAWYRPDGRHGPRSIARVFYAAIVDGLRPR
jgi:AcrR family transcriptional regulator